MTPAEIRAHLAEIDTDILLADGFDEALIGFVEVFSRTVALYDRTKCLQIIEAQGLSYEEAFEHFEYNVVGAFAGDYTPAFATVLRPPVLVEVDVATPAEPEPSPPADQ
jgi:hypothetical protein